MRPLMSVLSLAFVVFAMGGCGNTAEGVKEDSERNAASAKAAAQDTQQKVGEAAKDVGADMTLSPAINDALGKDTATNGPGNAITVKSTDEQVTLTGHVVSDDAKSRAEQIARQVITDKNGRQTVQNLLDVVKTTPSNPATP